MYPKPKKILQLISSAGIFGAENVLIDLSMELKKSGRYDPIVGVFDNSQNRHIELSGKSRSMGVPTITFPCRGRVDLKTVSSIARFVNKNQIDIIHSHGYKSNIYSYLSAKRTNSRLVATCHNWPSKALKMRFYALLDRYCLRNFDIICTVSEGVRLRLIGSRVPMSKIRVVMNGVSDDFFLEESPSSGLRKQLGISETAVVIGSVGRLSEEKGHRYLLRASKTILKSFPETVFLIVGDGPLKERLKNEFNSPSIVFAGYRQNVMPLYRCMDIFVLPSLTEGLPVVLIEAMAAKLPVIATNVGDIPKVIENNISGFLISPAQHAQLAGRIIDLMQNRSIRDQIGNTGYEVVKRNYSTSNMLYTYDSIYDSIARG